MGIHKKVDVTTTQQNITTQSVYFMWHIVHTLEPEFAQIDWLDPGQLVWSLFSQHIVVYFVLI